MPRPLTPSADSDDEDSFIASEGTPTEYSASEPSEESYSEHTDSQADSDSDDDPDYQPRTATELEQYVVALECALRREKAQRQEVERQYAALLDEHYGTAYN